MSTLHCFIFFPFFSLSLSPSFAPCIALIQVLLLQLICGSNKIIWFYVFVCLMIIQSSLTTQNPCFASLHRNKSSILGMWQRCPATLHACSCCPCKWPRDTLWSMRSRSLHWISVNVVLSFPRLCLFLYIAPVPPSCLDLGKQDIGQQLSWDCEDENWSLGQNEDRVRAPKVFAEPTVDKWVRSSSQSVPE